MYRPRITISRSLYETFHEQQDCVYDFPSQSLATRASANVPQRTCLSERVGISSDTPAEAHVQAVFTSM